MQYDYPLIEAAEEIGYFIEHPGNERVTPSMVIAHIMFSFETDPVVPHLHQITSLMKQELLKQNLKLLRFRQKMKMELFIKLKKKYWLIGVKISIRKN